MKKVVVERPRGQSYVPNRKFGASLPYLPDHDYDEQPKYMGISASYRDYSYSAKWLKDLLGPLHGLEWQGLLSAMEWPASGGGRILCPSANTTAMPRAAAKQTCTETSTTAGGRSNLAHD
jgi:hypothetical protein